LEKRLHEAVCAQPGETMVVLAQAVGATPQELRRPATLLRRQGRIRSAGQRQYTRYFPMDASPAARSGRREQGRSRRPLGTRGAARDEEIEQAASLLPRGVRDGHHPLGEPIPRSLWLPNERRRHSTKARSSRSAWL
jgi:hypothetical protein